MPRPAIGADVFRAIADETRRGLLDRLNNDEENVGTLAQEFDISLPAISQHLKVLRNAGLVKERRLGRERLYRLDPTPLSAVIDWLATYQVFWASGLHNLRRHLKDQR